MTERDATGTLLGGMAGGFSRRVKLPAETPGDCRKGAVTKHVALSLCPDNV